MNDSPEIAIVGAGPYALSLAAHLRALGVEHRIFGSVMHSWRAEMPQGMHLKSDGFASDLYDLGHYFTLKHYCTEQKIPYADEGLPVSRETFCAYGLAFQQQFVPGVEPQLVRSIKSGGDGFVLSLDDGQQLYPRKIVLAIGISHFQQLPSALATLPPKFCSHSSACIDPAQFSGRDITILGGGASALDLAVLLNAAGARVQLVARKPSVEFHTAPSGTPRSLWKRITQPKSGLGPSLRSLFYCEAPLLFHYLPESTRLRIARSYLGPAGGWFIRDQVLGKLPLLVGQTLQAARLIDGRVHLKLQGNDGKASEVVTDHVIAATGYAIDMRRLRFVDQSLLSRLRMVKSAPVLSSQFETSVAGLYVIGPAAVNSFGPVMRFAVGARFTASRLSARLARLVRQNHAHGTDLPIVLAD